MEFSYSFDATPAAATAAVAPLLASVPGNALALAADECLWRSWDGAIGARLSRLELHALSCCEAFAPRDALVARIASTGVPAAQAGTLLDRLVARGLLREPAGFVPADAQPGGDVGEPLVAIRTCARPASLDRLLRSLREDERRFGCTRRYVVVDDSRERDVLDANRAAIAAFASASRSAIAHFDLAARADRFDALTAQCDDAQRAAAAALLLRAGGSVATGALTWNWAVLLGAGGALSMLDDDFVFPLRLPPGAESRLEARDETKAAMRFFDGPAGPSLSLLPEEPFAYLRRFVGHSGAALHRATPPDATKLAGRTPADAGLLALAGTVQCAIASTWGAFAWDSSVYFNALDDASMRDLLRAPFDATRLNGDECWYGVLAPRLTSGGVFTPLLIDDRTLAPFATTWGKADDTAFLALFAALRAHPLMALVPASVGHAPPEPRDRVARSREPLIHDLNSWLAWYVGEVSGLLHGDDPALRLVALGALCAELAGSSDREVGESLLR
ncbi:MAG TPA: hypothetical protein VFL14_11035, partial [Xanthomonadales bacterium]|nr:hypothetical protein [Xanthomonadales bacterium]